MLGVGGAGGALEWWGQSQVLNLRRDVQDELGLSHVLLSHDMAVVRFSSDGVLVMKDGVFV